MANPKGDANKSTPAPGEPDTVPTTPWGFGSVIARRPEYIPMWALVGIAALMCWYVVDKGPDAQRQVNADNLRVLQEERERDRLFAAAQNQQITRTCEQETERSRAAAAAQSQVMTSVAQKLGGDMARLESAIDALRKQVEARAGGGCRCPEPAPMPSVAVSPLAEDAAEWVRLVLGVRYLLREHDGDDR